MDDVLRADDDSAYLAFIVDRRLHPSGSDLYLLAVYRYHDLPDYTVFLHADAPERLGPRHKAFRKAFPSKRHVPSLELLTDSVFAAARGYLPRRLKSTTSERLRNIGFVHFAHNYVLHDLACALLPLHILLMKSDLGRGKKDCEGRQLDPATWTLYRSIYSI